MNLHPLVRTSPVGAAFRPLPFVQLLAVFDEPPLALCQAKNEHGREYRQIYQFPKPLSFGLTLLEDALDSKPYNQSLTKHPRLGLTQSTIHIKYNPLNNHISRL